MLIDIHTHNLDDETSELVHYCHADLSKPLPCHLNFQKTKVCIGLHPWFLPSSLESGVALLNQWRDKLLSLNIDNWVFGECGLDRVKGPDLSFQLEFLKIQIEWAQDHNKPLIILHCVKAFQEMDKVIKDHHFKGGFIFHDFRGNWIITQQLLKNPKVYFSLGGLLFVREHSQKQIELIKNIPIERIFFETDDSKREIKELYERFANLRDMEFNDLVIQIKRNYQQLINVAN